MRSSGEHGGPSGSVTGLSDTGGEGPQTLSEDVQEYAQEQEGAAASAPADPAPSTSAEGSGPEADAGAASLPDGSPSLGLQELEDQ